MLSASEATRYCTPAICRVTRTISISARPQHRLLTKMTREETSASRALPVKRQGCRRVESPRGPSGDPCLPCGCLSARAGVRRVRRGLRQFPMCASFTSLRAWKGWNDAARCAREEWIPSRSDNVTCGGVGKCGGLGGVRLGRSYRHGLQTWRRPCTAPSCFPSLLVAYISTGLAPSMVLINKTRFFPPQDNLTLNITSY
ncbi:hypothetical protein CALVIDRAFT_376883 [Calocera viscosa TUFC12733]|uniref:Uncharacterized protein n=1 Tax=Calocera viscosa (strain TUFC12733) TaxID=1330018 RepID=A0A167PZQ8_CALVF|nr:hypothetical protein CALVIDRAFT_376883 [Calocera viscosa TUFC12733]